MSRIITGAAVGVDLGQANDPTAIAIALRYEDPAETTPATPHAGGSPTAPRVIAPGVTCGIQHLERLKLGTTYPDVVARVQEVLAHPQFKPPPEPIKGRHIRPELVVDATGVGRPVLDMMRKAGLKPIGVTVTGGDKATQDGDMWRVPKRELVSVLQVLLQTERLIVSRALPLSGVFVDELLRFKVKIDAITAHDSYGAWREGEHDDLVFAASIACWRLTKPGPALPQCFLLGNNDDGDSPLMGAIRIWQQGGTLPR